VKGDAMRTALGVGGLVIGLLCVAAGGVVYFFALDEQGREQARLDREWRDVQEQHARKFPRVLPPGRPAPAELHGVPIILGLAAVGGLVAALSTIVLAAGSLRPREEVS
jgi:hypothetical protein